MPSKTFFASILLLSFSCNNNAVSSARQTNSGIQAIQTEEENPYPHIKDIPLPGGFERMAADSFGLFLRNTDLKKDRTVYQFNGQPKNNQSAQFAVLDISVGDRDLQQCADAVMRLRAEYLFDAKKFEQIGFKDNNGKTYQFPPPFSKANFGRYLQQVFGACGSASLSKQLNSVAQFADIRPGDVLIRGGFPGHAVIVMDVAENAAGERIYLLAQSFMPAQDIHVLQNPMDEMLSPWFSANAGNIIHTPEYLFYSSELKRW